MSEFTTEADLLISDVDGARAAIEDDLGTLSVDVETNQPMSAGGDGGPSSLLSQGATVGAVDVLDDQLEVLEDIHDELEKLGQSAALAGSGGGDESSGFIGSLTGIAASRLPSLSTLGGSGAAAAGGGTGTLLGGGAAGIGLGLGGVRGLQEVGATQEIRGTGQDVQSQIGSDETQLAAAGISQLLPGSVENTAAVGGAALGLAQGDVDRAKQDSSQAVKTVSIDSSDLDALNSALGEPEWLSTLSDPSISEPTWLTALSNPTISEPAWLSEFANPEFNIEEPAWVSNFSGSDIGLTLEVPAPDLNFSTGNIRSELDSELESFKREVVDEAVREVQSVFSGLG
ncbi:hypothetical protein [Haloarcula sp. K1]|uniref:hypothetical protein n=1 Tax=Haloarcula sp. K1 TaxID=1622207 RepID=UPI0007BB54A0|nr:hypothetical protein [Haloarcula sp. K1]KZX49300.1 hypothetical protein AV929_12205 [Haloarcula sp. K1]